MKLRLSLCIMATLVALVGAGETHAQYLGHNSIGMYTVQNPTFDNPADWFDQTCWQGTGAFTTYVVLLNPWNDQLNQPIYAVGGFEFKLEVEGFALFMSPSLPPNATNFLSPPEYLVGACLPVISDQVLLITMNGGVFTTDPHRLYVTPVSPQYQSLPGAIAITDCNDNFRISEAYPSSGDFTQPAFSFNDCDTLPTPYTWTVGISSLGDAGNTAATRGDATDGYDHLLDVADNDTTVTFLRPEWSAPYTAFRTDVRADYDPLAEAKMWPFRINVPEQSGGATIQVDFVPSFTEISGPDLALTDVSTGATVNLWPNLDYSFYSFGGVYDFILAVGNTSALFTVGFSATTALHADEGNVAGIDLDATDAYDPGLDIPEPGPPPSDYLVASVERQGWTLGPRFQQDLQAVYDPLAAVKAWPILVETDQSGEVELMFDPSFDASAGIDLTLRDEQTGEMYSLWPNLYYRFPTTAAVHYRFTLFVGGQPMPDLTPTQRVLSAGWSLVGPPLDPGPGATLDDVLLSQVPGYGYAFAYSVPDGNYLRLDGSEPFGTGDGLWLATDTGFTWTMTGEQDEDPAHLPLGLGWNLVGYPLWFPGPVESVGVLRNGTHYSWADAQANNWVSMFMAYDQGSDDYLGVNGLLTWHGYWVAATETDLELVFDWSDFLVMPTRLSEPKDLPLPPEKDWRCMLLLADGSDRIRSAILGVNIDASDQYDAAFDQPRPPGSPSGGSSIALVRPEWDKPWLQTLAADITAPLAGEPVAWTIRIVRDKPGPVDLSWLRMGWPEDVDFQLYIPHENRVVVRSMRAETSITLDVGEVPLDVVLRTPNDLSAAGDAPFAGYRVGAHPNPFNPQTTISFDLPRTGRAAVKIYNLRGELVAEIGGQVMPAGPGHLVWRGQDRGGRSAASGVYFARLLFEGQPAGQTARLSLVR